jgi:hypothetical protein
VLVSAMIVWWAGMLFVALALASLWTARHAIAAGLRERLASEAPPQEVEVPV